MTRSQAIQPPLLQPSSTGFQGIDLPHNLVSKDDVTAFLRRKVRLSVLPMKQDYRAIIRESGFPSVGGPAGPSSMLTARL
jgi:hypothetical protein